MTDRELMQMALDNLESLVAYIQGGEPDLVMQVPAIEALRAALAAKEPEPVAWITGGGKGELWWHQSVKFDDDGNLIGENPDDIPLYTIPPQREWQGLTDEEYESMAEKYVTNYFFDTLKYARAIETKLRVKNGNV